MGLESKVVEEVKDDPTVDREKVSFHFISFQLILFLFIYLLLIAVAVVLFFFNLN
jgi:cytochrome bd-type quinol oxidase subunit 1